MRSVLVGCFADIDKMGGGSTLAMNVGNGLVARGHKPSFLSLRPRLRAEQTGEVGGIAVRYFSIDAGRAWRVPQLVRRRQLRQVLKRQPARPDVLLAISPFFIPPAREVWPDVRIVYLFPCLLWRCVPYAWEQRPSWPLRFNHWLVGREERAALDACDAVIIQSKSVAEDVLDFHPRVSSKLVTAPTGVRDLLREVSRPRNVLRGELQTPDDAVVAIAAGRLSVNKNVSSLLEAVHRVNNPKLWLWVVGDGPLAERLRQEAENGAAARRIRFLGSRKDMPDVYAAADLFIHAARYDNFPNVYLEAMVSGLPIVGPKGEFPRVVSPLSEMIIEGVQGHTYGLDKPSDLVAILADLADHPERIKEMGGAARELALRTFSWDGYFDAVEQAMLGR